MVARADQNTLKSISDSREARWALSMSSDTSGKAIAFLIRVQMWLQFLFSIPPFLQSWSSYPTLNDNQILCKLTSIYWDTSPVIVVDAMKTNSLSLCFLKCKEKSFKFCLLGLQNYLNERLLWIHRNREVLV